MLFVVLECAGAALLFGFGSYQGSVWLSSANAISGKCYEWSSAIFSYVNLRDANRRLTAANTELMLRLEGATRELERLSSDSTAMKAEVPEGYRTIMARVVESSIRKRDNLITIDKGSADGVKKNMGVVSGTGVAGIVYLTGAHYSVVIPVINSHSNISCALRKGGYFGYLSWTGGDPGYAYMEDVPRYARYKKGDIIQTNGFSSVFPQGITVGSVVCTFNSADGLSYRIKVKLATDFGCLYDVCVIDNSQMQEQLDILRAARDTLSNSHN